MNVPSHLSGQIPRQQISNNQAANVQSQQTGNFIPTNRIPTLGAIHSTMNLDPQLAIARQFVREKIKGFIMQKYPSNFPENRLPDIVRRLDEALWRSAPSKEEYVNMGTLERRLLNVITRSSSSSNQNQQQYTQRSTNSPSVIGTMIPTPGIPLNANPSIMVVSSVGTSSVVSNAGSNISNGYQLSPHASSSTGNNVSSVGVQRITSQMIPTPGFNSNNPSLVNVNASTGTGSFSTVDSAILSQPVMQKQHANCQTSPISHNRGSHIGTSSIRSHGFPNGAFNGGSGMTQISLQQNYDQYQQPMVQDLADDGYRMVTPDSSGPVNNLYGRMGSSGITNNNRNLKSQNFTSMSRTNSPMIINQLNLQTAPQHVANITPIEQSENINYDPALNSSEGQSQQQRYVMNQQFYQQDQHQQHSQHRQETCSPVIQTSQQLHQSLPSQQINSKFSNDQKLEENFSQRMNGQDQAYRNNLSYEGEFFPTAITRTEPTNSVDISRKPADPIRERQFKNQLRWMLLLLHARRCTAPEGKCQESHCVNVQQLLKHMRDCNAPQCKFPRCHQTKALVDHRKRCKDTYCPVCVPVKNFLERQPSRPRAHVGSLRKSLEEDLQSSLKRIKMEQPSQPLNPECNGLSISVPTVTVSDVSLSAPSHENKSSFPCTSTNMKLSGVKMEIQSVSESVITSDMRDNSHQKSANEPSTSVVSAGFAKKECIESEKEIGQSKQENSAEYTSSTKSGKPTLKGVSLIELFTPEQVREHIRGLRQWVGQSRAKVEKIQAMEHSMSENSCQLCAAENLTFEPPPIYCTPCGARVKRNAMYYAIGAGDTRHYFCIPCYNESRGDSILVDGTMMPKAKLEKKKNDEETEEWWVQCDRCEAWQHQICALFNGRRNDGGEAEYTCPNCYMAEVEKGFRKPLPQSAVLGAKDLPTTILSDHIEHRLFKRLKQERQDRARLQGKSYDEVPGAEALVVRVVSSVDKKLEVKPRFLENFQEENYPIEFPYKSKVVLLFQRIEGVEVCLFGMYVQEFGSECQQPNHRRVYLSYLDSVKYFRPEIRAASGEALRTFVYHEILTGYLEYCKKRGFTSCYIWACPPLKGEDYILYCHPEIQKTPKSDKLREWYLSMLKKASKENVVVGLTNLYDHFFLSHGECKAKVTAVRLPYFDGDYWPGSAEDMIYQLRQEEEGKQLKKGTNKKIISKRALKASGQTDLSGNASKDLLLMLKLGETISPMKEDFIMVHLQHACNHCCLLMVSGNRWVCNLCKNFQLCDRCYQVEQQREARDKHPVNQRDKHVFHPVVIDNVPEDTKDKDEILESEFFDTRQAFLSLCQGNHYQYDTLRRAKHSSMMVLYHLHNPTAPAFVTTCNRCHLDIETGQGWRCETCPDFDVCNNCYHKDGGIDHPHKLTNHPSMADRDAQNTEARQLRVVQLRKMLDLLVHASQCRSPTCQYPNCRKVKGLFRHGIHCKTRASGGCLLCKKMWYLLQLHARACKESQCPVPRCRDLNEHMRRLQQQSDSRRRAAVMEMMRQRAAEVAGNSG